MIVIRADGAVKMSPKHHMCGAQWLYKFRTEPNLTSWVIDRAFWVA